MDLCIHFPDGLESKPPMSQHSSTRDNPSNYESEPCSELVSLYSTQTTATDQFGLCLRDFERSAHTSVPSLAIQTVSRHLQYWVSSIKLLQQQTSELRQVVTPTLARLYAIVLYTKVRISQ